MEIMDSKDKAQALRDHDLIVTANVKLDGLVKDIQDIKQDLMGRMSRIETRLDAMDVYHAKIPLEKYESLANWTENFRSNIKLMMVFSGLLFGVISAVITQFVMRWLHI